MKLWVSLVALICLTIPAFSQTLSAADIKAQVDQRVAGLNEYQQLLSDPDPQRAMAAMQIMLTSKDPDLERMALEYGIYSPDPAVRRMALESFLATGPALRVSLDGSGAKNPDDFAYLVQSEQGTIDDKGAAFLSLLVGEFDKDQSCYPYKGSSACLIRVTDAGAAINLWNNWWNIDLGTEGMLTGIGDMRDGNTGIKISIPVTP